MLASGAAGFCLLRDGLAFLEARAIRLALDHGQTDEASVAVERWLKTSPESAEAHYSKARLAWTQGDLRTVDEELSRAEELGYSQQQLARLKGLLLSRGNRKFEAEPLLRFEFDAPEEAIRKWRRPSPGSTWRASA